MPGLPFPGPSAEQLLAVIEQAAKTRPTGSSAVIGPQIAARSSQLAQGSGRSARRTPRCCCRHSGDMWTSPTAKVCAVSVSPTMSADLLGGWWGRDESGRFDGGGMRPKQSCLASSGQIRSASPTCSVKRNSATRAGVSASIPADDEQVSRNQLAGLAIAKPLQKWTVYSWGSFGSPRVPDAWAAIDKGAKRAGTQGPYRRAEMAHGRHADRRLRAAPDMSAVPDGAGTRTSRRAIARESSLAFGKADAACASRRRRR